MPAGRVGTNGRRHLKVVMWTIEGDCRQGREAAGVRLKCSTHSWSLFCSSHCSSSTSSWTSGSRKKASTDRRGKLREVFLGGPQKENQQGTETRKTRHGRGTRQQGDKPTLDGVIKPAHDKHARARGGRRTATSGTAFGYTEVMIIVENSC